MFGILKKHAFSEGGYVRSGMLREASLYADTDFILHFQQ